MPQRGQWQSRHAKYKEDTKYIAETLANVAKQYGYFSRKSTYDLPSPARGYLLDMAEFIPLAEHIEKHGSNVSYLPPAFFERLDQCIDGRKSTHALHVISSQSAAAKASDERHEHFNNVMEEVRYRLRQQEELAKTGKMAGQPKQTQSKTKPSLDTIEHRSRPQLINLEERLTALTCLLDDFKDIGTHVMHLWSRYKAKELDLVTVSLATDLALDVAREFEEEIIRDVGSRDEIEAIFGMLWFSHCQEHSIDPAISLNDQKLPEQMYEILDYSLYGIRCMLNAYLQNRKSGQITAYKQDYYGDYKKFGPYPDLSPSQKFHLDKLTVMEALPHFEMLLRDCGSSLGSDRVTAGLMGVLQTGQITVTSTLAARIFLDVRHELGSEVERGWQGLSATTRLLINTVEQFSSHQNQYPSQNWLPTGRDLCSDLLRRLHDSSRPSQVTEAVLAQHSDSRLAESLVGQPYFLLKNHPLGCGVRLCQARFDFLHTGIACANSGGAVISCAHLYNALHKAGFVVETWTDIELLIERHTPGVFLGQIPSRPKDCQNQYARIVKMSSRPALVKVSTQSTDGHFGTLAQETVRFIRESYNSDHKEDKDNSTRITHDDGPEHIAKFSLSEQLSTKLNELCENIVRERPDFHIDYFQLHKSCWMVLRMVKFSMRDLLTKRYPDVWADEEHLPLISLMVLQQLADTRSDSPRHIRTEADGFIRAAAKALQSVTMYQLPQEKFLFGEIAKQKMICALASHTHLQPSCQQHA